VPAAIVYTVFVFIFALEEYEEQKPKATNLHVLCGRETWFLTLLKEHRLRGEGVQKQSAEEDIWV